VYCNETHKEETNFPFFISTFLDDFADFLVPSVSLFWTDADRDGFLGEKLSFPWSFRSIFLLEVEEGLVRLRGGSSMAPSVWES
jgi:hypothetical protein